MNDMIAFCGIRCDECPAYIATVNDDNALREKTANKWSEMLKISLRAEEINCLGCRSKVRISHCGSCHIRACALEHAVDNCSQCPEYCCERIGKFLEHMPKEKALLDELRRQWGRKLSDL